MEVRFLQELQEILKPRNGQNSSHQPENIPEKIDKKLPDGSKHKEERLSFSPSYENVSELLL